MMTDGVDDVAAANDVPKAEVLDVAQLLLGSLDTSSSHCPRRERLQRNPRPRRQGRHRSRSASTAAAEPEAKPEAGGRRRRQRRTQQPVTGLGIAGGAKRPGAKKAAPAAEAPDRAPVGPCRSVGSGRSACCQGPRHRRRSEASWRQEGRSCRRLQPRRPKPNPRRSPKRLPSRLNPNQGPSRDSVSRQEHGGPVRRRRLLHRNLLHHKPGTGLGSPHRESGRTTCAASLPSEQRREPSRRR